MNSLSNILCGLRTLFQHPDPESTSSTEIPQMPSHAHTLPPPSMEAHSHTYPPNHKPAQKISFLVQTTQKPIGPTSTTKHPTRPAFQIKRRMIPTTPQPIPTQTSPCIDSTDKQDAKESQQFEYWNNNHGIKLLTNGITYGVAFSGFLCKLPENVCPHTVQKKGDTFTCSDSIKSYILVQENQLPKWKEENSNQPTNSTPITDESQTLKFFTNQHGIELLADGNTYGIVIDTYFYKLPEGISPNMVQQEQGSFTCSNSIKSYKLVQDNEFMKWEETSQPNHPVSSTDESQTLKFFTNQHGIELLADGNTYGIVIDTYFYKLPEDVSFNSVKKEGETFICSNSEKSYKLVEANGVISWKDDNTLLPSPNKRASFHSSTGTPPPAHSQPILRTTEPSDYTLKIALPSQYQDSVSAQPPSQTAPTADEIPSEHAPTLSLAEIEPQIITRGSLSIPRRFATAELHSKYEDSVSSQTLPLHLTKHSEYRDSVSVELKPPHVARSALPSQYQDSASAQPPSQTARTAAEIPSKHASTLSLAVIQPQITTTSSLFVPPRVSTAELHSEYRDSVSSPTLPLHLTKHSEYQDSASAQPPSQTARTAAKIPSEHASTRSPEVLRRVFRTQTLDHNPSVSSQTPSSENQKLTSKLNPIESEEFAAPQSLDGEEKTPKAHLTSPEGTAVFDLLSPEEKALFLKLEALENREHGLRRLIHAQERDAIKSITSDLQNLEIQNRAKLENEAQKAQDTLDRLFLIRLGILGSNQIQAQEEKERDLIWNISDLEPNEALKRAKLENKAQKAQDTLDRLFLIRLGILGSNQIQAEEENEQSLIEQSAKSAQDIIDFKDREVMERNRLKYNEKKARDAFKLDIEARKQREILQQFFKTLNQSEVDQIAYIGKLTSDSLQDAGLVLTMITPKEEDTIAKALIMHAAINSEDPIKTIDYIQKKRLKRYSDITTWTEALLEDLKSNYSMIQNKMSEIATEFQQIKIRHSNLEQEKQEKQELINQIKEKIEKLNKKYTEYLDQQHQLDWMTPQLIYLLTEIKTECLTTDLLTKIKTEYLTTECLNHISACLTGLDSNINRIKQSTSIPENLRQLSSRIDFLRIAAIRNQRLFDKLHSAPQQAPTAPIDQALQQAPTAAIDEALQQAPTATIDEAPQAIDSNEALIARCIASRRTWKFLQEQERLEFAKKPDETAIGIEQRDQTAIYIEQKYDVIQKTIEPYTTELKKYLKASTLCCEISRLVEDKHVDAEKRSIDSNLRTLLRQLSLLCKYLHTHVLSIPNEKLEDLIKKLEAIRFLNNSVNNDLIQPLTESISNLQLLLCEIADSIAQVQGQTMTYSINNNPSMSLQDLKNQVPIDLLLKLIYNSLTRQAQSYITAYTTKTLNLISSRKTKREEKTRLVEKEKEKERRPALEETRFREKLKQMNRQHDFYSTTKDATTSKGKADNTTFWNETYSKIVNLLNKMNPDHLSPEEKSYFSDFMDFNFYQTLDHMQKFKTLMRNLYLKNNGSLEMNDWDELSKLIDEWAKDWNVNAMVSFMEVTLTS